MYLIFEVEVAAIHTIPLGKNRLSQIIQKLSPTALLISFHFFSNGLFPLKD
jgi:hypothetical protein